ncbi:MAG TPA: MarR family transcriptional regulator [Acidimicrobiales bacterium]|nr:MarR family transcriptional regulator [Acidimicrobiales bacterium]
MTQDTCAGKLPLAGRPRELLDSPVFLLGYVGSSVKASANEAFERVGANLYDLGILALLDEGARDTQASIADALGLDRGQLVGVLDDLEEQGLIERHRDPKDRRRHMVSLTPAGRRRLAKLRTVLQELEDDVLQPLGTKGRSTLHTLLLDVGRHEAPDATVRAG